MTKNKTLITGATGFVGKSLLKHIDAPVILTRNVLSTREAFPEAEVFHWNPSKGEFPRVALEGVTGVIHLAGENVGEGRWTAAKKRRIMDSRVEGTRAIVDALRENDHQVKTLVSASAIGFYGGRGDETLTEQSSAGDDFLADVCKAWEEEALKAEELGIRVAIPRIGIVLGDGGALAKMRLPFKLGLGGRLGSGQQWMSWIHLDDLCQLFMACLNNDEYRGPINAVSPGAVRNTDFTQELAKAIGMPALVPVPSFGLRLAVGEFATVLLCSQKVSPDKARELGFSFQYETLPESFESILQKNNAPAQAA